MYLAHFGLREYPFKLTPDTDFFFSSISAQEALNTVLISARTGEGFIKITGEVGTGKTTLCRKLMASLEPEFKVAYVPNPCLDADSLLMELATELGIAVDRSASPRQQQLLREINDYLLSASRRGQRVLVCLDEAQAMPIETLETLRLLTNLETEKQKLLQVILFGQPELDRKLRHSAIRQLRQRIVFHYQLRPMFEQEVNAYLAHRLQIAGAVNGELFTRSAVWQLKKATQCIPRLVNIIAHKSLISAYGKGQEHVALNHVLAAVKDTPDLPTGGWIHQMQRLLIRTAAPIVMLFDSPKAR